MVWSCVIVLDCHRILMTHVARAVQIQVKPGASAQRSHGLTMLLAWAPLPHHLLGCHLHDMVEPNWRDPFFSFLEDLPVFLRF